MYWCAGYWCDWLLVLFVIVLLFACGLKAVTFGCLHEYFVFGWDVMLECLLEFGAVGFVFIIVYLRLFCGWGCLFC